MEIIFTHSRDRWDQTIATRQDGVRVRVPVYGPLDPIPHDLAHYVIECELGLRDGFWVRVAAGALFGGMSVLDGRQRPHARDRSRAVIAATPYGIGFAEVMVGTVLRAINGEALGPDPPPLASPLVPSRTRADRAALVARLRPAVEAMCARWRAVPLGDTLRVVWPEPRECRRPRRLGSRPRHRQPARA
jgi:hypothetical protein